MQIGMIGLGRMGGNMARRLGAAGIKVHGFSLDAGAKVGLGEELGIDILGSLEEMLGGLPSPRIVWIMVPAGAPTEENILALSALLQPGDIVIDGGNSHYRDSQRRGALLAQKKIGFIDIGVSGGVWGLQKGYGLMLGGARADLDIILPLVHALAPATDAGWVYCGPSGAGHFAKMIHNGIEYGMMQAYAEGFAIMEAKQEFALPLADIAQAWRTGTVIRSWLLDLTADVLTNKVSLAAAAPYVADSGEGRWTAHEAIDLAVPAPVITTALMARFDSQGRGHFAARLLAMLRNRFGGHSVETAKPTTSKSK
jgi:6-phosphogluconate dehydrogenase